MINVKVFQAIEGDCIWLRYGEKTMANIIIDVGRVGSYKTSLKRVFDFCKASNEYIDLLIITHTDSDHISGITALSANAELLPLIKKVWFNSPYIKINDQSNDNISFSEGRDACKFFETNGVQVFNGICSNQENCILNGATITVLSPDEANLSQYNKEWIKSDSISAKKSDWGYGIEDLCTKKAVKDNSISNKASIAFLLEYADKKMLFLGDSVPGTVIRKLKTMGFSEENLLKLDLVKLSHHGSEHNFSLDLLKIMSCTAFLISSNASNLSKETIAKIIVFNSGRGVKKTSFYFNHGKDTYDGLLSKDEINKFNITCIYAKEHASCLELQFQ